LVVWSRTHDIIVALPFTALVAAGFEIDVFSLEVKRCKRKVRVYPLVCDEIKGYRIFNKVGKRVIKRGFVLCASLKKVMTHCAEERR